MQANYSETEIKSLLQKVRIFNKDIGTYQMFAITDNFDYVVKLSNGKILIKIEELQDDEKDALTPNRLTTIANRFVSVDGQINSQQKDSKTTSQIARSPAKRSTKKKKSVGRTFLIVAIVLVVIIVGSALLNNFLFIWNGYDSEDTYEEKVMTIEEIEGSQPTNFLLANGTYRENFWGDKLKVSCSITNKATVVTYKDAIVRVTYYTKTETVLRNNDYTIYETFPPNSTTTIELKINNYKNVNSIGWEVVDAKVY